jgi:hypothetical protein
MDDTKFYDMLDRALELAARELNARTADPGTLASKVLDAIQPAERAAALFLLLKESLGSLIARCCLLDECDNGSYAIEDEITAKLAEAIVMQGRITTALRELAAERIEHRAEIITVLASVR